MTVIDWKRIRPLLSELLERPREEHAAFLAEACRDDAALAAQARRIYAEECDDAGFLHSPFESADRGESALRAGDHVGPYQLVSELGRGGMGVVWLAERDGDFQQRVALKIVKRGMDTDEIVRRFRRERQLLADLDHPGIVRLLDGGATEDGRPYLALEVVCGVPIDEHCRKQELPLDQRLQLFARVCEAVESAHQLGVVHRDLKPWNVLVTEGGEPKVLDFGIAKVLSDEGPELSLLTRTGQRLLTPRYAAPEQVRGGECSPATDVYSLGVIFYELLCERPPYELETATLGDIESAVCEEIPRRPSHVMHGTTRRRLAGDLDVIVLRALAKDPARRYRDAGALARDVRRHLAHEPIQARPDSTLYRVAKYVRRHRLLVGSALAIILSLSIGLGASLVQFARSEHLREEAEWSAYVSTMRKTEAQVALNIGVGVGTDHRRDFLGWEWQHMVARSDLSLRVVCELESTSSLDLDPTGRTLAAGGGREIRLIDVASGEIRQRIATESSVLDVDFSPDGALIASSHRTSVSVHDVASCALVAEWPVPGRANKIRFHPDGRRIAASHWDKTVALYSLDDPDVVRELITVKGYFRDIDFSPDGGQLAIAGIGEVVLIGIDDPELDMVLRVTDREPSVAEVAFSHTGAYVAGICMDGTARVWERSTGLPVAPPRHYGSTCNAMAFLPNRDVLVICTTSLRVWDLDSGIEWALPGASGLTHYLVVHPEEPLCYTLGKTRRIQEWDARAQQLPRHHLTEGWCRAVSVHPDGRSYSVVLDSGRRIARVELDTGALEAECPSKGELHDLVYAPHGSVLVAARAEGIDVLDGETLETLTTVSIEEATCLAFTPDGERLVVGTRFGRLVSVDPASWSIEEEFGTDFEEVLALVFAPGGDELVVTGKAGPGVSVLRMSDRTWTPLEGGPIVAACSVACSPDGRWIAAGGESVLRVWSARTRSLVHEAPFHRVRIAFPEHSERLIACDYGNLYVLDTRRWDTVLSMRESKLSLGDMTLAPDGRTLLTSDWAGDVLVWNAVPLPDAEGD